MTRSVEEHRAVVAALISAQPAELVPLAEARGRVLARDLVAGIALPSFDNSAMDGYAVRAVEVASASDETPVVLPVSADVPAGRTDVPPLEPGTVHRIMTGAPMPVGADAVIPVERTDGGTERVSLRHAPAAGTHVRLVGEDVSAGTVVVAAGTVLQAAQIGVAAAVGCAELAVRRRPVVLVLSTGSELVAPGTPLAPGQIYESNGPMLAAAVEEAGGRAELLRFVPDDVEEFLARLAAWSDGVDLVLTSGGVSAGAYEVVKDAFTGRGVEFVTVAMQPGGPQGAGRVDVLGSASAAGGPGSASAAGGPESASAAGGPESASAAGGPGGVAVVTLPGNPVSSQVSFEVFVRPALRAAMGHPHPDRPVVTATLGEHWRSPSGRRQFRRGVLDAVRGTVKEVGDPASHLLAALAKAECLVVVPADVTELDEGSPVEVWLLDG